jgi:hypothetical protein
MKIVVDAAKLRKEIEERREKAMALRVEGIQKWKIKLGKYFAYVQRHTVDGDAVFRYPPFPPSATTDVFSDALRALDANTTEKVTMDSKEYNELLEGLNRVLATSVGYLASIEEETYEE